MLHLEWSS